MCLGRDDATLFPRRRRERTQTKRGHEKIFLLRKRASPKLDVEGTQYPDAFDLRLVPSEVSKYLVLNTRRPIQTKRALVDR